MRNVACFLLAVLAATLAAGWAQAATYTVPGSFSSIQAALNAAVAGDTIEVLTGTYFEKITFANGGNAVGGYVTLQAAAGHSPVLDGTGVSGANMVLIEDRSYVRLIGFEIRNNTGVNDGSGVRVLGSGSHIEIRNNVIHEIRGTSAMGITVYGTNPAASISNLIIDGNQVYDCDPATSEAITLNGNVELFEVTNNVVRDVNNIGIDFIGGETDIQPDPGKVARNGVCRGNRVYRARSNYGGGYAAGIYVDGGDDIVIERNIVHENDLGIEIGAENAAQVTSNVTVRDNWIYRNDKAGLVFGGFRASVGRTKNCSFLNNTLYGNDTLGTGLGELWIQFAEDNVVENNVFHAGSGGVLVYSEDGNVGNALDHNVFFSGAGAAAQFVWQGTVFAGFAAYRVGSGQDAASQFADPQLFAPASGDLHLRATSPAVDFGNSAFVPGAGELDIDGAPRVSGGRVDAGADEASCGNGSIEPGESCDDGNTTDCDGCDSNCTASSACGNNVVCAPEQCDDGNASAGDCCSPACLFESAGSTCSDSNGCTTADTCDGAGACAGSATPRSGCRKPTVAGASMLALRKGASEENDRFFWKWTRGSMTDAGDFGDPVASTGYDLCIFDETASTPALVMSVHVPGRARWQNTGEGFKYRDGTRANDGIQMLRLKPGPDGKAKILIKGKGTRLPMPSLPLAQDSKVTVQFGNDAVCWDAEFTSPATDDPEQFKDRSD